MSHSFTSLPKPKYLLEVSEANFEVKTKTGKRKILDNISFTVRSGEFLAMMGPSGAGKTTLLELMTMKLSGKLATGLVKLNGLTMTMNKFQQHACLVEQYDNHWAFLTCREIIKYAAELSIPLKKEREARVQSIMENLGLMECANTRAGNAFVKGISGGQKKRLSVGIALLKKPKVLFLDEPTSGLDAASTKFCMKFLEDVAQQESLIIIATIHQPALDVFMSFSSVLFLVNGRVAYNGSPGNVAPHCCSIGQPCPDYANPADHFIGLVNGEFVSRDKVDAVVSAWPKMENEVTENLETLVVPVRPGFFEQSFVLLRRRCLVSVRDPTVYIGRMIVFLVANSLISVVYIKAREREQKYVSARFFLTTWFVAISSMFAVVVVFGTNIEFNITRKEMHNGMARVQAYLASRFLIQIPYMCLLSLCAIVVPAYAIANYNMDGFAKSFLIMTTLCLGFEFMGEALGILCENPLLGMLIMVCAWFAAFLFSGNFLSPDFIVWPFRIFTYCFPFRWTIRTMNYAEFHGTEFDGAELSSTSPTGFVCPGASSPLECYGRTGDQVLKSLSHQFQNLSTEDTFGEDIAYCCIFAAVFKIICMISIVVKTRWKTPVRLPGGRTSTAAGTTETAESSLGAEGA